MTKLDKLVVGSFEVNCYLYRLDNSKDTLIIDPGDEASEIAKVIDTNQFNPKAVLLTHGHIDHIGGVQEIIEKYQIPLYAGKGEESLLSDAGANMSSFTGQTITIQNPDRLLEDEEIISLAGINLRVLATPGHSPGGVCFFDEENNVLFTGDTLFYSSIGRTDFPGCSTEQLLSSIQEKLMKLPDNIICYPGHGPETTIGGERINNPFINGAYFA